MTVPVLTQKQFFKLLEDNGWKVVSVTFWNDHDRVIFGKDGRTIPVQVLPRYFYPFIVLQCEIFGIKPPDEFLHSFWQHFKPTDTCYCDSGLPFIGCHGKQSAN